MTLCPVALAVGCSKCAAFKMCPLKGVIGDFKPESGAQADQSADSKRTE
ncbi:MAG: hypothetical protein NTW47_22730 [Proteobacteria bacterium]|jgi:hypothetical protein|nr:hypothetical protein [Pseudomonadota bacterium]